MNYLTSFKNAQSKFQVEDYIDCIRDCATITELGLKELIYQQEVWSVKTGVLYTVVKDYKSSNPLFENFDPAKSTLFDLLKFYKLCKFWDFIEKRVDSSLHFTKKIPWHDLRFVRNLSVHKFPKLSREQAAEFLYHLEIFLYETELAPTSPDIYKKSNCCVSCKTNLKSKWNFCPGCGTKHNNSCHNCKTPIETDWIACPYCQHLIEKQPEALGEKLYSAYVEAVWTDGVLNSEEAELLNRKREELNISEECAKKIEDKIIPMHFKEFSRLIEAVLIDGELIDEEKSFLLKSAFELEIDLFKAENIIQTRQKRAIPIEPSA